jgi:hypothetical protein
MAIDAGPYIRRARKLTRRQSGENFVRFSRQFAPRIPSAEMNKIRTKFNKALDDMMGWATSPKDVEMSLRHEASHIVAAHLLGFPANAVDLVPRMSIRVEMGPHTAILNVSSYGTVFHEYPTLGPGTTKEEAEQALAKLATIAAVGSLYEERMGYSNDRGVENLRDREKIGDDVRWAESETGMEMPDADTLWEVGKEKASKLLECPGFMKMVEAVAEVLSKSSGQAAVDGARKAVEGYIHSVPLSYSTNADIQLGPGCGVADHQKEALRQAMGLDSASEAA